MTRSLVTNAFGFFVVDGGATAQAVKIRTLATSLLLSAISIVAGREGLDQVTWQSISHSVNPSGFYVPERVSVKGEQAILQTESIGKWRWYGYGGPKNLHTRNLTFFYKGKRYIVPQEFVKDLLRLHLAPRGITPFHLRSSVNGKDVVFTLLGADGEKGYYAYFHFRDGRFFQRILSYSEAGTILIRTND